MKRLITFCSISALTILWIALLVGSQPAISYSTGSGNGGGNTGSPGDGGTTCSQSFCHNDASAIFFTGLGSISTDIPSSGYIPGQTYTITASVSKSGHNTFGFELTSEDLTGSKVGVLSSTSSATQLTNNNDAVTHTSSGISGSGSRSWSMDWQAPSAGTGEVVFHAAFNVANGNGTTSGDTIHVDSIHVHEDTSATSIPPASMMQGPSFSVYPNPADERINIGRLSKDFGRGRILLRDLQGRVVQKLYEGDLRSTEQRSFPIDPELEAGAYLLELRGSKEQGSKRILLR